MIERRGRGRERGGGGGGGERERVGRIEEWRDREGSKESTGKLIVKKHTSHVSHVLRGTV